MSLKNAPFFYISAFEQLNILGPSTFQISSYPPIATNWFVTLNSLKVFVHVLEWLSSDYKNLKVCRKILAAVQSDFDTRHWNFEDAVHKIIWPAQSYFSSFI